MVAGLSRPGPSSARAGCLARGSSIGLVLLVNTYFGPPHLGIYFVIFVVCGLLLAVRSHLTEREIVWRSEGVRYTNNIQVDFYAMGYSSPSWWWFWRCCSQCRQQQRHVGHAGAAAHSLAQRATGMGAAFSDLDYQAWPWASRFSATRSPWVAHDLGNQIIMDVNSSQGRY